MPPREVLSRGRDVARKFQDRAEVALSRKQVPTDFDSIADACLGLVPGFDRSNLEALAKDFPDAHSRLSSQILDSAESLMQGQVQMLGEPINIAQPNWHQDPLSDFCWEKKFYGDLQIYELPVDVKYVWELNRHQYLPILAQAWCLKADVRYADRVSQYLGDWIDNNPVHIGVNWTSGLEVAVRAISWIWAIAGLRSWGGWQEDRRIDISRSMADHAHYLCHHLSYYSSPYNHLVGESAALYMLSYVLRKHPSASRWRTQALEALRKRGPKQFYDDGFTVEQATGYHFFTLGFFLQAIITGRLFGDRLNHLEGRVERAAHAGALLRRPDGCWPAIGDIDSARSIPCVYTNFWDFSGVCAASAVVLKNEALASAFRNHLNEVYWLTGRAGCQWLNTITGARSNPPVGILPEAGYAVWANSHGDWVMMDCGPIGDGVHADHTPSVAHGHDDALSVHLFLDHQSVLHDSGMLRYAGPRECVDYFRSPMAHNRISVEGVSGAKNAGRLAWSNVSQKTNLKAHFESDVAFILGHLQVGPGVDIRRCLVMQSHCGLWVLDHVCLDYPRDFQCQWHFPEHANLNLHSPNVIGGEHFHVRTWCSQPISSSLINSSGSEFPGLYAHGYGTKQQGIRLSHHVKNTRKECLLVTHIGDPKSQLSIKINDATEAIVADSDSVALEAPRDISKLRLDLVSPVQDAYVIDYTSLAEGMDSRQGVGELPVYRVPAASC